MVGKRILACLMCLAIAFVLSGCWNYRSLDELNIVVGLAIDYDKETKMFLVDYEIADLVGADKQSPIQSRIVRSEGKTIFDAARNAKRKEEDRLYFGSANTVVISHQVAKEIGLNPVLDWILRDAECRETVNVVISQEETAANLLETTEGYKGIMSVTINQIIREDKKLTASGINRKAFELYGNIHSKKNSAVVPVMHKKMCVSRKIPELNGVGILKGDKLIGYLSPEQTKYLLYVIEKDAGGLITLSVTDMETDDITLEVFKHLVDKSISFEDDKIKVKIKTKTYVGVAENLASLPMRDKEVVRKLERAAEEKMENGIRDVVSILQQNFRTDVIGFGEMIYRQNLKLWEQLEPDWDKIFPTVEVDVSSKVEIFSSAYLK